MKLVLFKKEKAHTEEYRVLGLTREDKVVELVAKYIHSEMGEIEFPIVLNSNNILSKDITSNDLILTFGSNSSMCQVMLMDIPPGDQLVDYHWSKGSPKPVNAEVFTWKRMDIIVLYRTLEKLKKATPPDSDLD